VLKSQRQKSRHFRPTFSLAVFPMPKPATAEVVTCGPLMVSGRRNKEEVLPVAEVLRIMQSSDLWVVGRRYGEAHVATLAMPKYMAASQTADLGELQKVLQCDLLPQKLRHDAAVSFLGNVCTILDMHSADFGVAAAVMMNLGFLSGFRPLAAICRDLKLYDRVASVLERFHASEVRACAAFLHGWWARETLAACHWFMCIAWVHAFVLDSLLKTSATT
jgi:hypothetical protein